MAFPSSYLIKTFTTNILDTHAVRRIAIGPALKGYF